MVLNYYNLAEQPFGVTPDPRYLYPSSTHREALASALYGVSAGRGFTALIARPGMGKTTLLFDFLNKVRSHAKTVFLFQSQSTPQDLLRSLLADLGIDDDNGDLVRMHRRLNECLVSLSGQRKSLVVVLDEAQNLDDSVLEVVRMLSNFETPREKLMHLVLAGQPQLAERLSSPRLVQLRQRISIIARLKPFTAEETQLYVNHRLRVAGYDFARPLFTKPAQEMIARFTEGIPRNINNVCFNAMSLGCVAKQRTIDVDVIGEVLGDLDLSTVSVEQVRTESVQTDSIRVARPNEPTASMPVVLSPVNSGASSHVWRICTAAALAVLAVLCFSYARTRANAVIKTLRPSAISRPVEDHKIEGAKSATSPQAGAVAAVGLETVEPRQAVQSPPSVEPPPSAELKVILVRPDETLYRISVENVGKYDTNILARLRDLNPWLSNPNHIEVGQKIRFPHTGSAPQTNSAAEQVPAVRVAGSEKP